MNIKYKGINIFYTDSGKGHAIVLLHGFLESTSIWEPFIKDLSKKNRESFVLIYWVMEKQNA